MISGRRLLQSAPVAGSQKIREALSSIGSAVAQNIENAFGIFFKIEQGFIS